MTITPSLNARKNLQFNFSINLKPHRTWSRKERERIIDKEKLLQSYDQNKFNIAEQKSLGSFMVP